MMMLQRAGKGAIKEATLARRLLWVTAGAGIIKVSRAMVSQPNIAGATDSSQRMENFTEARRLGIAAGEVDRYPHRPWLPQT